MVEELPWYRRTNYVGDIQGASPAKRWERKNKPNLYLTTDIDGAQPRHRRQWFWNNKPDGMTTLDIDSAQPKIKVFRTKRIVNPLNPEYQLPEWQKAPTPEPRFIRDSFNVDDIEGAQTKTSKRRQEPRDPLAVEDIDGAKTKPRTRVRTNQSEMNSFDVSDIVRKKKPSKRVCDPQNPEYFINCMTIQDDPRTKPRATTSLPRARRNNKINFSLYTQDIQGAQADSIAAINAFKTRQTYIPGPIDGATADSLQRGLVSKRQPTNPLDPVYRSLDGELLRCSTAPHNLVRMKRESIEQSESTELSSSAETTQRASARVSSRTSSRLSSSRGSARLSAMGTSLDSSADSSRRTSSSSRSKQEESFRAESSRLNHVASVPTLRSGRLPVQEADEVLIQKRKPGNVQFTKDMQCKPLQVSSGSPSNSGQQLMRQLPWKSTSSKTSNRGPTTQSRASVEKAAVMNLPENVNTISFMFPNKSLSN